MFLRSSHNYDTRLWKPGSGACTFGLSLMVVSRCYKTRACKPWIATALAQSGPTERRPAAPRAVAVGQWSTQEQRRSEASRCARRRNAVASRWMWHEPVARFELHPSCIDGRHRTATSKSPTDRKWNDNEGTASPSRLTSTCSSIK